MIIFVSRDAIGKGRSSTVLMVQHVKDPRRPERDRFVPRSYGKMSSPSVLFALEETLRTASPGVDGDFWLVSFGAGFSAHSCRLGSA